MEQFFSSVKTFGNKCTSLFFAVIGGVLFANSEWWLGIAALSMIYVVNMMEVETE